MSLQLLLQMAAGLLALALLPGLLHLAVLTAAALVTRRPRAAAWTASSAARLQIVVPAHDEAAGIAATAQALKEAAVLDSLTDVLVVADNCSDNTAELARQCGVRVLERQDPTVRGKGAALRFAFDACPNADWFLVIDADSRLDPGFLSAMRAAIGQAQGDLSTVALQARYLGEAPAQASGRNAVRARLVGVAMMAFNVLRPMARHTLGQSCGVLGNGFAVRASAVRDSGWGSNAIVEDADQHLRWQAAGLKVRFVSQAVVRGELPLCASAARSQRARWEGGRLNLARRWMPRLAGQLLRGRAWAFEPLADLLLPPLAHLSAALMLLALLPLPATRTFALVGLTVIALHVLAALRVGGARREHLAALLSTPAYIGWKLSAVGATLRAATGRTGWVRTARNPSTVIQEKQP